MNKPTQLMRLFFLITLVMLQQQILALPEDSQQPINIQADRASQQSSADGEVTEYFGNVEMTQGSMKINGDHIVIHSRDRKVTSVKATGNPARFEQQSQHDEAPVVANARQLDYTLNNETIVLTTDASIEKPGATFNGDRIEYNIAMERVKARGGEKSGRVNMVLTPENKQ